MMLGVIIGYFHHSCSPPMMLRFFILESDPLHDARGPFILFRKNFSLHSTLVFTSFCHFSVSCFLHHDSCPRRLITAVVIFT
jgi:hypothetical protein